MPYSEEGKQKVKDKVSNMVANADSKELTIGHIEGHHPNLSVSNQIGRPRKYKTPQELAIRCDQYFNECMLSKTTPSIVALSLFLGFSGRQGLYDYRKRNDDFSFTVKRAISFVESIHEQNLSSRFFAGSIFWLKNENWKDKQDIELNQTMSIDDATEVLKGLGIEIE